jgi:hypothetical protein
MGIKFSSVLMVLMFAFIAKVSFETATAKNPTSQDAINDRSPASIDQSYLDHLNK